MIGIKLKHLKRGALKSAVRALWVGAVGVELEHSGWEQWGVRLQYLGWREVGIELEYLG